jgi:hypothetical protein
MRLLHRPVLEGHQRRYETAKLLPAPQHGRETRLHRRPPRPGTRLATPVRAQYANKNRLGLTVKHHQIPSYIVRDPLDRKR